MKKVIITGATGFIGGALAKRLLADGVKVYGVGRNSEKLEALKQYGNFVPVIADFTEYGKLHELIEERDFDAFYHLAWNGTSTSDVSYKDYAIQVANIKTTCDAANSAAVLKCSSIIISSSSYQESIVNINNASNKIDPFNPVMYGVTKRCAAEMFKAIAHKNKIPCINLIFPNTYGPGDKLNTAIVFFIRNLLLGKPLQLISGIYQDDWMYIDDLVEGIISASQSGKEYGDYYVGHRRITTFKEKFLEMKEALNSHSELQFGTYPENYYVDYRNFNLDALYHDTAFEAKTSFKGSILRTAEWLKRQAGKTTCVDKEKK